MERNVNDFLSHFSLFILLERRQFLDNKIQISNDDGSVLSFKKSNLNSKAKVNYYFIEKYYKIHNLMVYFIYSAS